MNNSPKKLAVFIILFLTPLIIFNGCRMLGIRENKKQGIPICGEEPEVVLSEEERERNRKEQQRIELLRKEYEEIPKRTFIYDNIPSKMKVFYESFIKNENLKTNSSSFEIINQNNFERKIIYFIAHEVGFEETFRDFQKTLEQHTGAVNLYLHLATKNLLYVEKITNEINNSKVNLHHICIHSNEPSWYYIKGTKQIDAIFLTGEHEIIGVEKSATVREIYIESHRKLKEFTCNMDKTELFFSNGKINDKTVFPDLFNKPKKLQTVDIRHSDLKEMPDLSANESMDIIKYYFPDFEEINLDFFPKKIRYIDLYIPNNPKVIPNKTKKNVQVLNIRPTKNKSKLLLEIYKMRE